jgi:uncharacterized protein YkwD
LERTVTQSGRCRVIARIPARVNVRSGTLRNVHFSLLALLVAAASGEGLPPQAQLETAMQEAIAGSCPGQAVAFDRELTDAARAFVLAVRTGAARAEGSALSFYASLASPEPAPIAGVATVSPPALADRAASDIFPKACRFNRAGIAAAVLPSGEAVVAALTAQHATELARIPGSVEPGAQVEVAGQLAHGLSSPRLFVTHTPGDVEEIALATVGDRFSARVLLKARGEHSVEVVADGAGGPQVIALRRIFAGVPPPSSPPPERAGGTGLDAVENAIARLRAGRGLPKLTRDPQLDAVAAGHSKEMARTRTFAHVLESDGSLTDRLRKTGYAYRSAGENIGLSQDAATAHEAVAGSPAHLANLLDPRHRRLGLGAVRGRTPDGEEALYLTEVLAAPIVGTADPAADVEAALRSERRRRGLPMPEHDVALSEVARKQIRALALADALAVPADVVAKALESDPSLQSAVAELFVGSAPDETLSSKALGERRWTRLGVGAMYASSKKYGPGRLWVLILYGN